MRYAFDALLLRDELTELWQAHNPSTGQVGLVRQIRPGANAEAAVLAIERETTALRHLCGEGLPQIVDAGSETVPLSAGLFQTADIDWSTARRLDAPLAERPLAAQKIAWLLRLVAEAAQSVAQAGWQHGRLGVDRLLLTADHRILLFDFTSARRLSGPQDTESADRRDFRRLAARLIVRSSAWAEQVAATADQGQALSLVRQARPDLPVSWLVEVLPLVVRPSSSSAADQSDWARLVSACLSLELLGLRGSVWRPAA